MNKNDLSIKSFEPLLRKIEELDKIQRLAICVASIAAIAALFYFVYASPVLKSIKTYEKEYAATQKKLNLAKEKAKKLKRLQEEWEMKTGEFQKVMRALPEKEEIPSLLTSISQSGRDTGVLFSLFEPKQEIKKGFYGEIPVEIKMTGAFHNSVMFFDKVTSLNRIVNIRDVQMKSNKEGKIETNCKAVTYKFIEQEEQEKTKKKGKKRRKK